MATKTKNEAIDKLELFKDNSVFKLKPRKDIIQISNSKIGLFNTCYLQFYFRYLTDYPVKPVVWPATLLGEALHKIVELSIQYMNANRNVNLKKLKKEIQDNIDSFKKIYDVMLIEKQNEFKKSRGYDYDEFVEKGEKYRDLLINFVIGYFYDYDEIKTEAEFKTMWKDNVEMIGYIDLLARKDKEYSIFDLKVTKDSFKYYFVDWDFNFQSQIYEMLTYKSDFSFDTWAKDFSFIVCNHEDKTLFFKQKMLSKPDDIDAYFSILNSNIDSLINFIKDPRPMNVNNVRTITCRWCNYNSICPFNKNK